MQLLKNVDVDWMGIRWWVIGFSALLALAGTVSLFVKGGPRLGVDFTGGTLVHLRFTTAPEIEKVREALRTSGIRADEVTRYDEPSKNQVQIKLARVENEETDDLNQGALQIAESLRKVFDPAGVGGGKLDLNSIGVESLSTTLQRLDPEGLKGRSDSPARYSQLARYIVQLRTDKGGLLDSYDALRSVNIPQTVVDRLRQESYLGSFTVLSIDSVGPKVGKDLQSRARDAILFSLLGMLVYIAIRFKFIYGVAGIIALFHDVFLTLGFFSLANKEISLTVVAALLTLVGYSINDTIVIFDRIRENLRGARREDLESVVNASINQTLNRTVTTSGLTFLSVIAIYLFGGEVLNGFSFALVVGIIIGSYSTIAIAAPILVWWQRLLGQKRPIARHV